MPPAVPSRVVIGMVILLMCAIASLRSRDTTRTHMITEVVSVTSYVPARTAAPAALPHPVPVAPAAAPAPTPAQPPGVLQASAQPRSRSKPVRATVASSRGRREVAKASLGHRRPLMTARASDVRRQRSITRVACRSSACCEPDANHAPAPAQLPAIFLPVRNLGLMLESRLVAPQERGACAAPIRPAGPRQRPRAWTSSRINIGTGAG
jgi:hypothetical protein